MGIDKPFIDKPFIDDLSVCRKQKSARRPAARRADLSSAAHCARSRNSGGWPLWRLVVRRDMTAEIPRGPKLSRTRCLWSCLRLVLVALGFASAISSLAWAQAETAKSPALRQGKHFDRVLLIVLENQNYSAAMKDKFLADLARKGTSFSNFKNLYHPSYPNYLAMIAGSSFGVRNDSQKDFPDDREHRTIADLLDWSNYAEDYPAKPNDVKPFLSDEKGKYARKHVPFLSFKKIQSESFRNVVSVDSKNPNNAFVTDIQNFRKDPKKYPLPRYMFYSPNLDDDGHDPSSNPPKGLQQASIWLKTFFETWFPLEQMKGTLVVVTFDESEHDEQPDRIYTVFLGDMVKVQEIKDEYNHYSVLRTIEDNFGLKPIHSESGDGTAEPVRDVWK